MSPEVVDGLAGIRAAAPGTPVPFYRQPGGYWSPTVVEAMNRVKLRPLGWSDDPKDWSRPGSTVIVHRVVKNLHPGAVILMHDGGGDRSQSVEALAWLLKALPAAGWKPVLPPRTGSHPKPRRSANDALADGRRVDAAHLASATGSDAEPRRSGHGEQAGSRWPRSTARRQTQQELLGGRQLWKLTRPIAGSSCASARHRTGSPCLRHGLPATRGR